MRRLIEGLSLLILVTVTIVRPLVPETYDSGVGSITAALGSLSEPYPVRTLIFDLLILSGTCGWLLVRAMEPGRAYRRTGLEYGAALVAVACVASCLTAGNKRLAINASLDWLCLPVLTIALVQLMYKAWHRRVFLAALLATACVQSAQCFDQYFLSFDDTWEHYQSVREDLWATQGVELDAPQVTLFERRLLAREASGALSHSNIAGSYLVLCGFPAVGVLLATWRRARDWLGRLAAGGAALGTGVILSAVPLTKSLGAMVSAAIGVVLWSVLWHARKWTKTHRVRAVVLGWGVAAAALGTTLCYGVWRGSFPHSSLTFRWKYWVASYDMIADHALTGVGRENFGRHYLQYKAIESPEEVTNPHNVLVQAAAEWGLPGALGLVVMLIGASVTITSGRRPEVDRHSLPTPDKEHDLSETSQPGLPHRGADPPAPNWALIWMVALLLAVTVGRWHLHDTDDPNYLYFITVASGVVWLTAFLCFGGANVSTTSPESSEPVVRAAAVGLFAFILHDMISFALFVPSAATTAFALLAFCMAGGSGVEPRASGEPSASARTTQPTRQGASRRQAGSRRAARWMAPAVLAGTTALLALFVVFPVARACRELVIARGSGCHLDSRPIAEQPAYRHYLQASACDTLDPTPCVERADWLLEAAAKPHASAEALQLAVEALKDAEKRDPFNVRYARISVRLYMMWAQRSGDPAHYLAAVDAARAALRLYPLDPVGLVKLGDCQADAGISTASTNLLTGAVESYRRALALDSARPQWEKIRRFSERKRREIRAKIERAVEHRSRMP